MKSVFLWIYCLSITHVFLIILGTSVLFLLLQKRFTKVSIWKHIIEIALITWLIITAFATLFDRIPDAENTLVVWIPFHSYYTTFAGGNPEVLRSNFMNVVLFYPAGLLACELLPKDWRRAQKLILTVVLFALLSAGIEVCQYHFALGQAEVDDVIHNTLGTLIGAMVSSIHISGRKSKSSD